MNSDTAEGLIIALIGGTVVLTTIDKVTSDKATSGPTLVNVLGGVAVAVPLLIVSDFEPGLAALFAFLIFTGKLLTSQDVLSKISDVFTAHNNNPFSRTINTVTSPVSGGAPGVVAQATGNATIDTVMQRAYSHLGNAFSENPNGVNTWDCSLFVQDAWKAAGVPIPRTTFEQVKALPAVAVSAIQPGDLIYLQGMLNGQSVRYGHVWMAVGNGLAIEAPRTGENVKVIKIDPSVIQAVRRPAIAA